MASVVYLVRVPPEDTIVDAVIILSA